MQNDLPGRGVEDQTLHAFREHRLSWVAYLGAALKAAAVAVIGGGLLLTPRWMTVAPIAAEGLFYAGLALLIAALLLLLYRTLWIRRVRLYSNEDGIWCYRGILPWRRGVVGINWRDVRQASYDTGFIRWLTKAYPVQVDNRFTDTGPITLSHVHRGHEFVGHVNARRHRMLRQEGDAVH